MIFCTMASIVINVPYHDPSFLPFYFIFTINILKQFHYYFYYYKLVHILYTFMLQRVAIQNIFSFEYKILSQPFKGISILEYIWRSNFIFFKKNSIFKG
jgi:hypothetical protein